MVFRPHQSGVFHCVKCGFDTSGIIVGEGKNMRRFCRDCNSPYVLCNYCGHATSGTTMENGEVKCDHCNKVVAPTTPKL